MVDKVCKLSSGATFLYNQQEDDLASFAILFDVGSIDEQENEKKGIAHCLEHMMFKGTKTKTSAEFLDLMDKLGVESNAFTSFDVTCYHGTFHNDDTNDVIKLFGEMITEPRFDSKDLELEKGVIHQEIIMGENDPQSRAQQYGLENIFKDTPFARPVIGYWKDVNSITPDDLRTFMYNHYTPSNCIIAYSGKTSFNDVRKIVEDFTKKLSNNTVRFERKDVKVNLGAETVIIEDKETKQNTIMIGGALYNSNTVDGVACILAKAVLSGGLASRLVKRIREELGLCYYIGITNVPSMKDFVCPLIVCITDKDTKMVEMEIKKVIAKAIKEGFEDEEIKTVKKHGELVCIKSNIDRDDYAVTMCTNYQGTGKLPSQLLKTKVSRFKKASKKSVNEAVDKLFCETISVHVVKPIKKQNAFKRFFKLVFDRLNEE